MLSGSTKFNFGPLTPGGSNTNVQYNDGGVFGGSASFTFNKSTLVLTLLGSQVIQPASDIAPLTIQAGGTSTSIKSFDVKDSGGNSWAYIRKRLLSDANIGALLDFNTSGSGATSRSGLIVNLNSGFTGAEFTGALGFDNNVAGTATYYTADQTVYGYRVSGNRGFGGFARATTTGHNVGGLMLAGGGAINYGSWSSATISKASAINVGVFGNAYNASATSPSYIGGYFTIYNTSTAPPNMTGVKTALLADNQTFAVDIFLARDNGSNVFAVADNGATSVTPVATAGGVTAFTIFPGAHTAVTSQKQSLYIRGNTVTITGSFSEQNTVLIDAQTFDASTAQTITTASTFTLSGAPTVQNSAAITNAYTFWIKSGNARLDGNASIGVTTATARLHLAAGTATASTAPLKFSLPGVPLTAAEAGVMETDADNLYYTVTTGTIRRNLGGYSYRAITASRTLDGSDELVDCTSGTFPVTLPTAVGFTREYVVKNSGTGIITLNTTSSQTIDGVASGILTLVQYDVLHFRSNGSNWIIV